MKSILVTHILLLTTTLLFTKTYSQVPHQLDTISIKNRNIDVRINLTSTDSNYFLISKFKRSTSYLNPQEKLKNLLSINDSVFYYTQNYEEDFREKKGYKKLTSEDTVTYAHVKCFIKNRQSWVFCRENQNMWLSTILYHSDSLTILLTLSRYKFGNNILIASSSHLKSQLVYPTEFLLPYREKFLSILNQKAILFKEANSL